MTTTQKLRQIQKNSGITQEELALDLGVSFPTVNSCINGRSQPRTEATQSVEAQLGSDAEDLFFYYASRALSTRLEGHQADLAVASRALTDLLAPGQQDPGVDVLAPAFQRDQELRQRVGADGALALLLDYPQLARGWLKPYVLEALFDEGTAQSRPSEKPIE